VASRQMLGRLRAERDYVVVNLVEAQMVGSAPREKYWRDRFWELTGEIDALCRELGLPVVDTVQLPLFLFVDDRVTDVTTE
jgi:hypothetical protein